MTIDNSSFFRFVTFLYWLIAYTMIMTDEKEEFFYEKAKGFL